MNTATWTAKTPYGIPVINGNIETFTFGDLGACRQAFRENGYGKFVYTLRTKYPTGMSNDDGSVSILISTWSAKPTTEHVKVVIAGHKAMVASRRKQYLRIA